MAIYVLYSLLPDTQVTTNKAKGTIMRQLTETTLNAANTDMTVTTLFNHIEMLTAVNEQIARLAKQKDELTDAIIKELGHTHEGQRSYTHDVYKIEVKTPFTYGLNKSLYETDKNRLDVFNPVKETITYTVDKSMCDKYLQRAPDDIKDLLTSLVTKKAGKPSVTITSRSL